MVRFSRIYTHFIYEVFTEAESSLSWREKMFIVTLFFLSFFMFGKLLQNSLRILEKYIEKVSMNEKEMLKWNKIKKEFLWTFTQNVCNLSHNSVVTYTQPRLWHQRRDESCRLSCFVYRIFEIEFYEFFFFCACTKNKKGKLFFFLFTCLYKIICTTTPYVR